jgi:hypothetical protein
MKKIILTSAAVFAASVGLVRADLVAGWDFSQFTADASDDIDFTFGGITELKANYSDLDTDGFGAGAQLFGTATWGSSSTFAGYDAINYNGGLSSGQGLGGISTKVGSFDLGILGTTNDGQFTDSALAFSTSGTTNAPDVVTFALTPGTSFGGWAVQFGGLTADGTAGTILLETSNDGVTFGGPSTTFNLGAADTLYSLDLAALGADDSIFARITFSGNAVMDNLAFSGAAVPEPSTYAAIFGVVALAFAAYRRRK